MFWKYVSGLVSGLSRNMFRSHPAAVNRYVMRVCLGDSGLRQNVCQNLLGYASAEVERTSLFESLTLALLARPTQIATLGERMHQNCMGLHARVDFPKVP